MLDDMFTCSLNEQTSAIANGWIRGGGGRVFQMTANARYEGEEAP